MEEDQELAAIRARRLAEMQSLQRNPSNTNTAAAAAASTTDEARKQMEQQEQLRQSILLRILTSDARERLSRISMVKPERARALEDLLINTARTGQLRGSSPQGQLTEQDLVGLLERIGNQESSQTESKIRFQRRNVLDDDDF